jgi:hypothetical protein
LSKSASRKEKREFARSGFPFEAFDGHQLVALVFPVVAVGKKSTRSMQNNTGQSAHHRDPA